MQATWRGAWGILILVVSLVMVTGFCANRAWADPQACNCPHIADPNGDNTHDVGDLVYIMEGAFSGYSIVTDAGCPKSRSDVNADGVVDVRDVTHLVDYIFWSLTLPVNPCDCAAHPEWCAPVVDPDPGVPGNSVVVESRTVLEGEQDAAIHIKLTNDVSLRQIVLPLVIRSVTPGAYITSVSGTRNERLTTEVLADGKILNQLADPNGSCSPGGFGTVTFTYHGFGPSPVRLVDSSPEGLLLVAGDFANLTLAPGSDVNGSFVLTVDVTSTSGIFEIDTTCTNPANHLMFVQDNAPTNTPIVPQFTKGVISIVPNTAPVALCQNVSVSAGGNCQANASVNNGSYDPDGGPVTVTETPSGPYSLGVTPVTLIVTDIIGAADTCQANVTVIDDTPPVLSCPSSMPTGISPSDTGVYVNYNVTATDNCPGTNVVCTPPSGSFFEPGVTPVVCVATDAAGLADTCTFSVVVFDQCFDRLSDANCDGITDLVDVVTVINIAFRGGHQVAPCPGYTR